MAKVELEKYSPRWARKFEREAEDIAEILGPALVISHHIGSTAVPGTSARPIIDLLLEVTSLDEFDPLIEKLTELDYAFVGDQGMPGRRFFIKKNKQGRRTHNLFVFPTGHPGIRRCLDFRDYLIAHAREAKSYGLMKQDLVGQFPEDLESYMAGKEGFILDVLRRADAWRNS